MAQITSTELGASGRYIRLVTEPEQDNVGPQTIMGYCRQAGTGGGGFGYLFGKNMGGSPLRIDFMGSSGSIVQFGANSTGSSTNPRIESPVGTITNNVWTNIACTWDGTLNESGMASYKDGVLLTRSAQANGATAVPSDSNTPIVLMNREDNARFFVGDFAYLARWNRILSQAEMDEARNNGPLNVPDGLILCWANQTDLGPLNMQVEARSAYVAGQLPPNLNLGGDNVVVDHAADGDVIGNTADITGEVVLTEPATVHQATGAVAGLTSTVTGAAKRFLHHATSGAVVDSNDATVTGEAELINAVYLHETEGVLTRQLGTVTGATRRFVTHITEGELVPLDGAGDSVSKVAGQAEQITPPGQHEAGGILTGQRGTITGTAKLQKKHTTSGVLAGKTSVVLGGATKFAEHDASGIVVGYDSKVMGSAVNQGTLTLTPADIDAIVAALVAEILPVNIVRVNGIDVKGSGTGNDPWGPV